MKYLNKLMFIDSNNSSAYSLDDVLGKAVMNPVLGAPELKSYEFKGKDKDRDLAYLSIGYLVDVLEKGKDAEKLKESNPEAYNTLQESENKLNVLYYYYGLFENMVNNWRISKAVTSNRGNSVTVSNLTNFQRTKESYNYLLGEFYDWMRTEFNPNIEKEHTCGLPNYFDNALRVLKNYSSTKEFSKIEAGLKNGKFDLFLKSCKIKAKQLESDGADYKKYYNILLAQGASILHKTVSEEDKNMKTTDELVIRYLGSLERTGLFKIDEDVKEYLPLSIVDILNESGKIKEEEKPIVHVDLSGIAQVVKAEG